MIDAHPGHSASLAYLGELVDEGVPLCASLQVCRELMVAVTRKPIGGRVYTNQKALAVLEDWLQVPVLLAEDSAVAGQEAVRGRRSAYCGDPLTCTSNSRT